MGGIVTVEIAGQRYPIRSALDPAYVAELAAYVEHKIQAASDVAPTSDTLGQAVLAALNIADECFRAQRHQTADDDSLNRRALALEALVDEALAS
jgi:cell division protein ZapA (FtsZ GTPase activity inhibitor)